jgi:hypothetical protein
MATQIDWLQNWDKPFDWTGLSAKEIAENQQVIEDYATKWLALMDEAQKLRHPRAKSHKIKFIWHGAKSVPSFIVVGHLTPAPTAGPGGGGSLLTPTPPPQP